MPARPRGHLQAAVGFCKRRHGGRFHGEFGDERRARHVINVVNVVNVVWRWLRERLRLRTLSCSGSGLSPKQRTPLTPHIQTDGLKFVTSTS